MNLAGMCLVKEEAIVSLEMRHEYQRILKVCLFECRAKIIQKIDEINNKLHVYQGTRYDGTGNDLQVPVLACLFAHILLSASILLIYSEHLRNKRFIHAFIQQFIQQFIQSSFDTDYTKQYSLVTAAIPSTKIIHHQSIYNKRGI